MQLTYTEEQTMLRDAVSAFLADTYDIDKRRTALDQEPGWRPDIWQSLAQELGLLGAAFPEELGGFGGGATEHLLLMEEFGRSLVVEPYLSTVVLGGGFLKYSGYAGAAALIEEIVSGEAILAFAQAERGSRYNLACVETRATADADGWVLDGHKKLVISAPFATHLIVTARTAGDRRDKDGISIFLLDRNTPGVSLQEYKTYDGFLAADVAFANVKLGKETLMGDLNNGLPLVERVVDEATAALCGEAAGVLEQLLNRTVEYAKERKQFGRPIGSFQALQHRMADMFVEVEQATSMAISAAIATGDDDPVSRSRKISIAKAQIGNALRKVGQGAIQIHGGMGMTQEMPISQYFKRATILENMFGSVDYHLQRIENLSPV
ncbi:MAG: acyl-CoA dehydrogenase family protein [Sphingorhabdus sp.]